MGKMNDPDMAIAYQNKDIGSKSFAERLKGKSLEVFGLSGIEVEDVLPTNLPAIEANELRLDNLFKLSTGEYAIVDYESGYSEENKFKYIGYIARVTKKLYNEHDGFRRIRMIVIYTADVEEGITKPDLDLGGMSLHLTESFLIDLDSRHIKRELKSRVENQDKEPFTEEDMMRLAIFPLTYKGKKAKQNAVSEAIDIAEKIQDERMQLDAMMGILTFSDKVIAEKDAMRIKRRLKMTKVERLYEEEKQQAVETAVNRTKKEDAKKAGAEIRGIASNLLRAGDTVEKVIQCTGLSRKTVQSLAAKL